MSDQIVDLIRSLDEEDLTQKLHDAADEAGTDRLAQDDIDHLLHILTNSSLVVTSIFDLLKFEDLIDAHFHPGALHLLTETVQGEAGIQRLLAVPDHVKVLGDKCLFETGVAGNSGTEGLNLAALGQRSYQKAARILELLSEDRRLQAYFEQNQMGTKTLPSEVEFLTHCADRFADHTELLQVLLQDSLSSHLGSVASSPSASISASSGGDSVKDSPTATAVLDRNSGSALLTPPTDFDSDDCDDVEDDVEEDEDGTQRAGLRLVSRSDEENDEIRFRELMIAEKTVLFSALDTDLLRTELNGVVIQQEEAINTLCDELCLYSTGTQDVRRPASYFLIGPTGVGKNYLVESMLRLFEKLWGIEVPYLELEGPEFTYPSDINELKGAARGFIRSDEEGVMTQFYKRSHDKPISVILVDEIEKAHPQLRRFFLPIMDRGTMMDNRGKVLHFENSLIFFTSNIGYSDASRRTGAIGYGDESSKKREEKNFVLSSVKKSLSPEFINRLHLVHFKHLTRDAVNEIYELELNKIKERYEVSQGIQLNVTEAARAEMMDRGYSEEYGARNLTKVLSRHANIEVSKVLKRDEDRRASDVTTALSMLREMRDGSRNFDEGLVKEVVSDCSRVQVPYSELTVDCEDGDFVYKRG